MKKKHMRVLQGIQDNLPKDLLGKLMVQKPIAPALIEIIERGLVDPEVTQEVKDKLQLMKDTGAVHKTKEVVDPEVEQKIIDYYETEIEKLSNSVFCLKKTEPLLLR